MRDLEKITEQQQVLIRWKQGSAEADSLIAGLSQNIVKTKNICITIILLEAVCYFMVFSRALENPERINMQNIQTGTTQSGL